MTTTEKAKEIRKGDIITFTNKVGCKVTIQVSRVEEKSWYYNGSRNSYGTLAKFATYPDFFIIRK